MKKYYALIIFFSLILTGCWNYRDVDDLRLLTGMAIDYDKDSDEFIVTVEIINPASEKLTAEIFQAKGKTVFEAIRDTIMKNGRKLFVAHAKIVIVSEYVAKNKMLSVIDYLSRDAEYRDDISIIVSKKVNANEILKTREQYHTKNESSIHQILSYFFYNVLKNEKSVSRYHNVPLWKFLKALLTEGQSPTLPAIDISKPEFKNHNIPKINETAVFRKDKLIGYLNSEETKSFLSVIGELKGGIFVVEVSKNNKTTLVSLDLVNSKTNIKPIYENNELIINIDIKNYVNIAEISGDVNIVELKGRKMLKKKAENKIKNSIEKTIKKVQIEYKTDIFNFSSYIKKSYPKLWKKINNNWKDTFSTLKTNVNVEFIIRGSSQNSRSLIIEN